jgi:hypothetical protein
VLSVLLAVLLTLDRHDYVHPRLSPDGKQLVVARVFERPDGNETTDVLLIDVASGKSRELLSRKEAEKHEVYETYVTGLQWLSSDRVAVSLSDGDVGGVTLTVDTKRRRVVAEEIHEEDQLIPPDLASFLANAERYAAEFDAEVLTSALGGGATRLASGGVIVHRQLGGGEQTSIFILDDDAQLVATVPREEELGAAIEHDGRLLFTLNTDTSVRLVDRELRTIATMPRTRNEYARFRVVGSKLYLFIRPGSTNEAAKGRVWELVEDALVPRHFDENLDDFSFSADGSRVAISYWKNGRRAVRVTDLSDRR